MNSNIQYAYCHKVEQDVESEHLVMLLIEHTYLIHKMEFLDLNVGPNKNFAPGFQDESLFYYFSQINFNKFEIMPIS